MKQRIQTEAVVVLRHEHGEADRLVVLLTKDRGKLSALARGARRSQKRFGGCLELGSLLHVVLTDNGRGSWLSIEEAQLLDGHHQISSDLLRIAQVAACCVTCGQERSAHWFFDPVQGGLVCQACANISQSIALDPEALKLVRALQAGEAPRQA